jgi:hypothetical protein
LIPSDRGEEAVLCLTFAGQELVLGCREEIHCAAADLLIEALGRRCLGYLHTGYIDGIEVAGVLDEISVYLFFCDAVAQFGCQSLGSERGSCRAASASDMSLLHYTVHAASEKHPAPAAAPHRRV